MPPLMSRLYASDSASLLHRKLQCHASRQMRLSRLSIGKEADESVVARLQIRCKEGVFAAFKPNDSANGDPWRRSGCAGLKGCCKVFRGRVRGQFDHHDFMWLPPVIHHLNGMGPGPSGMRHRKAKIILADCQVVGSGIDAGAVPATDSGFCIPRTICGIPLLSGMRQTSR